VSLIAANSSADHGGGKRQAGAAYLSANPNVGLAAQQRP